MKLIQYRFASSDLPLSSHIGDAVQNFFATVGDVNLWALYTEPRLMEEAIHEPVKVEDLSSIVSASFVQSFAKTVDHEKWKSVRSAQSCRFVDVYYDGLVRICYSNDDEVISFKSLSPEVSDISEFLIKTDIFDHW